MDCLACEVASMKRQNAALRGAKHWQSLPTRCELHSALASARVENTLRTAQALHEQIDGEARAAEARDPGHTFWDSTRQEFRNIPHVVERRLSYPFGHPNSRNHPSRLPLQAETERACVAPFGMTESRRTHELRLLDQAVASGLVRKVG